MPLACIDIGSNTTRLLVAEAEGGRLRELMTQRAFTLIGKALAGGRRLPAEKIAETAEVVATQVSLAQELEASRIAVVATAAIRRARNRDELAEAVRGRSGLEMRVLSGDEEARLSFLGATKTLGVPVEGRIGVVDVGGGSTEIVVGTCEGGVEWAESFRLGSGFLTDSYVHSDPPGAAELHAICQHVAGVFEGLDVPRPAQAVAVGGSATSLRRVVGSELGHESVDRAIRILSSTDAGEVARRFELEPERVRLMPAGILIIDEVSRLLGLPLTVGNGGLREGVILEMSPAA